MVASQSVAKLNWTIDRRHEDRILGRFRARLRQTAGKPLEVFVHDLSVGGFCCEWPHRLRIGDRVWLRLEATESLAAIVSWTATFMVGCAFEHPLHPTVLKAITDGRRNG
jgi:hypothetical protein